VQNNYLLRLTTFAIVISIIFHAFFGFYLDFSVDEAHYALYGAHLDWSYFDHPPLVGWVQALPIYFNFSEGLIRLILPEILWCICIFQSMAITRLILERFFYFSSDTHYRYAPYWTALIITSSPLLHVLSVGLLPDTLLLVIVPTMIWCVIKLHIELSQRFPKDFWLWMGLGLTLGLAALSKYTSIFFAISAAFCLIHWHGLKFVTRVGFWFCLINCSSSDFTYSLLEHATRMDFFYLSNGPRCWW
jgi:4-amino-4-deoxy-L-arabinose transferase-like glycosyltransferase